MIYFNFGMIPAVNDSDNSRITEEDPAHDGIGQAELCGLPVFGGCF